MLPISSPRFRSCLLVLLPVLLTGCTGQKIAFPEPPATHLVSVPFYPQDAYQCGPAALATVLDWSGAEVDLDSLVSQVYLPGLQGSLQPELIAAARSAGRIPYPIPPSPASLGAELAAGHPVLVLQNLGLDTVPQWHYAVVVGYDPGDGVFILRSGTEKDRRETVQRFMSSWQRGRYWGVVVLEPGQLPASQPLAEAVVRAIAQSELSLSAPAASIAWEAALARWPGDADVLFGAANALRRAGDDRSAAETYQTLLNGYPAHAAARNNFADLLLEAGCAEQAAGLLEGIRDDELPPALALAVARTRQEIALAADRPGRGDTGHCERWNPTESRSPAHP